MKLLYKLEAWQQFKPSRCTW